MKINKTLAKKVLSAVSHGLTEGIGIQEPGKMCVEAAVCYAMGLPHGDDPTCVGRAVKVYSIYINDTYWSSKKARAEGMRRLAIAQLGSNDVDQLTFAKRVAILNVQKVLSKIFRDAKMELEAKKCEKFNDFNKIVEFTKKVALKAASHGVYYKASVYANAYANIYASHGAKDYAHVIAVANAIANTHYNVGDDKLLTLACESAVQALQEQNCEGCKYLYLTDLQGK